MEKFRLEYSQKQNLFHYADIDEKKREGWEVVVNQMNINLLNKFMKIIKFKRFQNSNEHVSFDIVKKEMAMFLRIHNLAGRDLKEKIIINLKKMEIIFEIKGENNYEERFVGDIEIQDACVCFYDQDYFADEIDDYIRDVIFPKYKKLYLRFMNANDIKLVGYEVRGTNLVNLILVFYCVLIN